MTTETTQESDGSADYEQWIGRVRADVAAAKGEPLVMPADEFELVRRLVAAGDTVDWKTRALAAEARVCELEATLGHFAPAATGSREDGDHG